MSSKHLWFLLLRRDAIAEVSTCQRHTVMASESWSCELKSRERFKELWEVPCWAVERYGIVCQRIEWLSIWLIRAFAYQPLDGRWVGSSYFRMPNWWRHEAISTWSTNQTYWSCDQSWWPGSIRRESSQRHWASIHQWLVDTTVSNEVGRRASPESFKDSPR